MWESHNWTKFDRLWIGAFTLFPVLVGIALVVDAFREPLGLLGEGDGFCVLCLVHPLMVFMLLLVYVPAVLNNARIAKGLQYLWILGFLCVGLVSLPSYWYRHIWSAPFSPDDE